MVEVTNVCPREPARLPAEFTAAPRLSRTHRHWPSLAQAVRSFPAEVAKGALRVLARAATGLPTQQVVRLLLEMARAGMGQELNALAAVLSAPGVRKAPEVVALAAAVAPDEALCQQTLQQAGLVALAACFTYNWCDSRRPRVGVSRRQLAKTCMGFVSHSTARAGLDSIGYIVVAHP
jgi:hypothetical protein